MIISIPNHTRNQLVKSRSLWFSLSSASLSIINGLSKSPVTITSDYRVVSKADIFIFFRVGELFKNAKSQCEFENQI